MTDPSAAAPPASPFKTLTVDKIDYLVLPFPLEKALNTFDVLLKTYGESLMRLAVISAKQSKGVASNNAQKDLNDSLLRLKQNLQVGDTLRVVSAVLTPEYVKTGGAPLDLQAVYAERGFLHIYQLFLGVVRLNYTDFLGSGPPAQ